MRKVICLYSASGAVPLACPSHHPRPSIAAATDNTAAAVSSNFLAVGAAAPTDVTPAEVLKVPLRCSRSNAISLAEWKRDSGFFSRQCCTIRSSAGETLRFVSRSQADPLSGWRSSCRQRLSPMECALSREHLVENCAETENVGARIERQCRAPARATYNRRFPSRRPLRWRGSRWRSEV